jgi:hypothetical protein
MHPSALAAKGQHTEEKYLQGTLRATAFMSRLLPKNTLKYLSSVSRQQSACTWNMKSFSDFNTSSINEESESFMMSLINLRRPVMGRQSPSMELHTKPISKYSLLEKPTTKSRNKLKLRFLRNPMVHYLTQGEAIRHKSLSFMK